MARTSTHGIPWRRAVALTTAGCLLVVATRLQPGLGAIGAGGIAGVLAIFLLIQRDVLVLTLLVPLAAIAIPGWIGLPMAAIGGLAAGLFLQREGQYRQQRELRPQHEELVRQQRDAAILEEHLARFPRLQEVCLALGTARDTDALGELLVEACVDLVPELRRVQVSLHEAQQWRCRGEWTAANAPPASEGELIDYAVRQWRRYVHRSGPHVIVVVPLGERPAMDSGADDHRYGVLVTVFPSRGLADLLVIEILDSLGRLGSLGLVSLHLVTEARSLALTDDLTGLLGQHEFRRRLEEQVAEAHRRKHPLAVLMCDMDHLKRFNDRWGHAVGDKALRAVAEVLCELAPDGAQCCRYGGEEFAVVVPGDAAVEVDNLAEAIRAEIRALRLPDLARAEVSASIGWALLVAEEGAESVLRRADTACYQAKETGRDRVVGAGVPA